jgi:outer membrane protein assembly factor BamA
MNISHFKYYIILFSAFILLYFSSSNMRAQEKNNMELTNIEFVGNDFFNTSELEEIIISKESSSWISQFLNSFTSFGNPPSYFDSLDIQDDLSILKNYYKSYGFFKTKFKAEFTIEKNGKEEVDLIFNVTENFPSSIRNYNFNGLDPLPKSLYSDLSDLLNIDTTIQYSEELVEQNSAIIISFLQDQGYMMVQSTEPVVQVDTVKNVVDINVDFKLGNRYRISEVNVEKSGPGKELVREVLIDEIANISTENYYNYNELKLAQVRLYRTNLFSSAVIAGSVQDTVGNYVPVNIITKVGLLNELSPEIILINEDNTLKLGLGLSYINKNFLGDARKLTIGASAAAQNYTEFLKEANLASDNIFGYTDARVNIEQPFLFGSPINTQLETYYTLEKKKNQWNASIYGAKLNLNYELPRYVFLTALSTYLTWQNSKYIFKEEYLEKRLPDSLVSGSITTNSTSAILGVQLIKNNTDDLLFPTEGYFVSILAEDGNSLPYLFSKIGNYNFSQAAYYKFVLTTTTYFSFMKNVFDSFGMKFKIGNIHAYHGDLIEIPYNQRLTAGGSNSVRGWGSNDLPIITELVLPQNPTQNDIENVARNITPGGFFLVEGSIEGRELLSEKIGLAIFMDYGNVWNKFEEFSYNEMAVAAGFGFRYYSDFAPIRLDFGFKAYDPDDRRSFFTRLRKSPFLKTFEFHLGIGEAF